MDGPHDFNFTSLLLIVDILNDEAKFVMDVVIRADILIDLNECALPLSQIHAAFRQDIVELRVGLPFKFSLCISIEHQVEIIWSRPPLRHQDDDVVPWL